METRRSRRLRREEEEEGLLILSLCFIRALCASAVNGGVILAQAFVKNIVATYIGRQTDCHGDILNPPSPGLMRRENNSVMSSTKNEAVVNHVKAQKTERTPLLTVARFSLWLSVPDSFLESARSDSRFRRDWFVGSRPLWPLLVAHLFIWNDKYFDQPLPQLAIDWEDSSVDAHFFLERTPAHRRNTIL